MAVNLSPVGGVAAQFFTSTGAVLTGGKLYTYLAGTTTPAVTYTTSQGTIPWTNPVVLDAAGRVPGSGEIWLTDGIIYKFVLKDSNDVLIATYDNITGINSNSVAYTNQQEIVTATAGQTVFNLGISYQPGTNSLSVFVDGVNQYGPGAQYSYVETDSTTVTFNSGLHVGAEVKFTTTQQQGAGAVDAAQVSYDPPFTGSVITNVEAKLAQTISAKDFGAVGDGVTDDTSAIQAAINALPAGGILDGGGDLYCVTSCNLKSNMTLQNFNFFTKAGSTDFVSPVTIGANSDTSVKSNINIYNVHVDGNRINQTNIGGPEDGGRHGFRLIGHLENITIRDCSANYCATDGIEIYSGIATGATFPYASNVLVENCVFTWNRRHGNASDGTENLTFRNCIFNDNGQDLNSTDPLNSGGRGARSAGQLYGNGSDIESYGVPTQNQNLTFDNCIGLRNARGGLVIYDPTDPAEVGFTPNAYTKISKCQFDTGTTGLTPNALEITSALAYKANGPLFTNVVVEGCKIEGNLSFRSVDGVSIDGGSIAGDGSFLGNLDYATNVVVGTTNTNGVQFGASNSTVQYLQSPSNPFLPVNATLASGATLDLGLTRTLTYAVLTVYGNGLPPSGGNFAATVYLAAGAGAFVSQIYNTQVGTSGSDVLQIVTTDTTWKLKNNAATTIGINYLIQI